MFDKYVWPTLKIIIKVAFLGYSIFLLWELLKTHYSNGAEAVVVIGIYCLLGYMFYYSIFEE